MSFLSNKKLKNLENENEELRKLLDGFSEKENQIKHFDDLVKKARLEYAEIVTKKDQTAQKLESLEKEKTKLNGELKKISIEINQLREIKLTEQNQINLLTNAVINSDKVAEDESYHSLKSKLILSNEIEAAEKRKNHIALETFKIQKNFEEVNNKITDGKKILDKLNSIIEKKKEEISSFIIKQGSTPIERNKSFVLNLENQNAHEIQARISYLINIEKELSDKIVDYKNQLDNLENRITRKKIILDTPAESSDKEIILEHEIKLEVVQARLTELTEELKTKRELHNDLNSENKKVIEELRSRREELTKLNESIEIETIRLTDLDYSLTILENEFDVISKDISDKMSVREKLDIQINEKLDQKVDLEDILRELKETTTILAQLKNDIETGSGQSAKRFTGVLQYYSTTINDIYKKKSDLEKTLTQKEKELINKEILIDERKAALDEMENILFVRHRRSETIKDLTRAITEQRKLIENSGFSFENIDQKNDGIVNNRISQKKILDYENALKEIINTSDKYASDLITKRTSLEKEITENKNRLNELNQGIRHSTNELSELNNSISKIKMEHEEHRVSMNKLASIKTKLEDQIDKYKLVIDNYFKIKEKIREEQEIIKMKRSVNSSVDTSKNINEPGKSMEQHNPKWIKL